MNEILQSLKADLLDRRLLPILLAVGVLLVGAVAYATLVSGSGSSAPGSQSAVNVSTNPVSPGPNLAVTQAPANPHAAIAETTVGGRYRHKPGSHDPFAPLPLPKIKGATARTSSSTLSPSSSSSKSSTPSAESKSQSPTPSTGGSTPSKPATPTPHKPKTRKVVVETVGVQLGPVVVGGPSQLTSYPAVKIGQQLPSSQDPQIVFSGLYSDHKHAVFTLSREAILKGPAVCLPSATQCEKIILQAGQTEELGYLEADGQTVSYELVLQTIAWHEETVSVTATTSSRHHRHGRHHHR